MRLAFLTLALALPAASSALPTASPIRAAAPHRAADSAIPTRICDMKVRPARSPEGVRAKRLGELPPGDLTSTVLNRVGDCFEPVIVRQGFGAFGGR